METGIAKEGVQEVGKDGEDGNDIEAYDQDFSLWWIISDHFIWLWRKGREV